MPRHSSIELPLTVAAGGVRVQVRLTPQARSERLDGVARLADGAPVLKVAVVAPPEDGRANDALLRLLAKEWRLARRNLSIVAGARSRSKTVLIAGDTALLIERLSAVLAGAVPSEGG